MDVAWIVLKGNFVIAVFLIAIYAVLAVAGLGIWWYLKRSADTHDDD